MCQPEIMPWMSGAGAPTAANPLPRRGRAWVILALGIVALAVGYAIVDIATKPPGDDVVRVEGIGTAQRLFGGVPEEEDRVGSEDAPVSFNPLSAPLFGA